MAKSTESRSVGYSTSITIGGKKYNSFEISSQKDTHMKEVHTVTGMEHAPRQIGKELRNESGIRQTDMNLHKSGSYDYYNQRRVQTESTHTPRYTSSASYERTPSQSEYRSQYQAQPQPEYSSSYSGYSQPESNYNYEQRRIHTDNIQTASQMEASSYERAQSLSQSQSQYKAEDLVYRSSNAESRSNMTEALGYSVNSQATRVQTMDTGSGLRDRAEQSQPERSSYYSSYSQPAGNYNHEQKRIHTDNIQTASQMEASSYERAQSLSQSQYKAEDLVYRSSDVESKSNMTEALGYNVSSQASRIHTLEQGNSFRAGRESEQGTRATSYNAPAGYYNREQTRIHTDNIQTESQQEASAYERVQEHNLANAQYDKESLIYHSSDVESRGTMAESLGSVGRLQKPGIMTEDDKGVTKAEFNSKKFRIHADHLETTSKRNNATVGRVVEQSKSLQSNNVMTSESMQSMMTQGMQMVGGLKMLDAIDQNRSKDEDENFADAVMPLIKTAIKAGIVVNAVGTVSNYTTGSDRKLLHPEEDGKAAGVPTGGMIGMGLGGAMGLNSSKSLSWYESNKKADYIRSFSAKKGASPRSWGLSDSAVVSEKSGLFGNLGGNVGGGLFGNLKLNQRTINTGIQNNVMTGRTIQTAVGAGAGIGGLATMWNPMAMMFSNSLLKKWNSMKNKVLAFFTDPAESLTSSFLDMGKMIGLGAIIPILIIVVAFSGGTSTLNTPLLAVSSFFSGLFDRDDGGGATTEMDIRTFISDSTNGIPALRDDYLDELTDTITNYLDDTHTPHYDIVRLTVGKESFYYTSSDGINEDLIDVQFYSVEDLTNIIQPIFNAYILMEYNLQISEDDAYDVLKAIFDALINETDEALANPEYCGVDLETGEGTATTHAQCGKVHALENCPNEVTGTHSSYTCSDCCHYDPCPGDHWAPCTAACLLLPLPCPGGHTRSCGTNCDFDCNGYSVCGGHSVRKLTVNLDGIYRLIYAYFTHPIEQLEGIASRTPEQEEQLEKLKSCYELFEEMMKLVNSTYDYGALTKEQLLAIDMDGEPSTYGNSIIQVALSQLGYAGGERYWKWYFPNQIERVEWCACFVSWCMNEVGHTEVKYASCAGGGVPYFQGLGSSRWKDGSYTTPVAGDVIFFDWDGGGADHTGLVVGTYNGEVYTIEGNSGDAVKIKKYTLGSSVIYGYGIMN